jgi:hypothetical protein
MSVRSRSCARPACLYSEGLLPLLSSQPKTRGPLFLSNVHGWFNIVAYLFKARTVEPEKQDHPLLGNTFLISKYTQPLLSNAFTNTQVSTTMSSRKNRGTVRNGIFYAVRAKVLSNEATRAAVI